MSVEATPVPVVVETVSLLILLPLLLVGGTGWFFSLKLTTGWVRRPRLWGRWALQCLFAVVTSGALLELLNYGVRWASEMPLLAIAGIAGTGMVLIHELYARERGVTEVRIGRAVLGLRLALFILVLTMLNQPVLRWTRTLHVERRVAVLVDDSASMQSEERLWMPGEMMDALAVLTKDPLPGRPDITSLREYLTALQWLIREETIRPSAGEDEGDKVAAFKRQVEKMNGTLEKWLEVNKPAKPAKWGMSNRERLLSQVLTMVEDTLVACRLQVGKTGKSSERSASLAAMASAIDNALAGIPGLQEKLDKEIFEALDSKRRNDLVEACRTNRAAIAARLLMDRNRTGAGILETLEQKYGVDVFMMGDGARRGSPDHWAPPADFRLRTDLGRAFDTVRQQVPANQLAGVLLLSDGCDNGETGIDSAVRRLGVPVHSIVLGGTRRPVDSSLYSLHAPDTIFLGDRVRVMAQVQITGAAGQTVKVSLFKGDKVVDEATVVASSDFLQKEIRLNHAPDEKGISHYRVEVSRTSGEYAPDNNSREFDVAVTDDRLNVLLVDSYPRWEFKYLRNLFFGRDKSINLQFVLLDPDELNGQAPRTVVQASASRPYEEAEATALPATPEEWRKFGVIIIGDVGPETLKEEDVKAIRASVTERGALLVAISGPRSMPGRWTQRSWMDMMPLTWTPNPGVAWAPSPEAQFHLRLTSDGRQHMLAALSDDATENDEIWTRLPPLSWRTTFDKLKPGAQLIAFAEPMAANEHKGDGAAPVTPPAKGPERGNEQNALLAIQQYGQGKVAMLGYDQTWRLRYQVGDTYHHRFWGQIVRWGAGERLRAGGEFVRLGTDRLNYSPGETVHVTARLLDRARNAVKGRDILVAASTGETVQARITLTPREGSYGIFEGDFPAPASPGSYRLKLEGSTVDQVLADTRQEPVQTVVTVMPPPAHLEVMKLNADPALLDRVAAMSGGSVHRPCRVLPDTIRFGEGSQVRTVVIEKVIWDTWLWFVLVVMLATAEWLLRRKGGLV